jgi:hypothetical protein
MSRLRAVSLTWVNRTDNQSGRSFSTRLEESNSPDVTTDQGCRADYGDVSIHRVTYGATALLFLLDDLYTDAYR